MLFRALKKPLAESVGGNLSESSDDSSASYVLSSDSITSSDSSEEGESNEETPSASLSQKKAKTQTERLFGSKIHPDWNPYKER